MECMMSPHSSMDRTLACGAGDRGSNPLEGTIDGCDILGRRLDPRVAGALSYRAYQIASS